MQPFVWNRMQCRMNKNNERGQIDTRVGVQLMDNLIWRKRTVIVIKSWRHENLELAHMEKKCFNEGEEEWRKKERKKEKKRVGERKREEQRERYKQEAFVYAN